MRRVVTIGLICFVTGCLTPSIPIPPPDPDKMEFHIVVDGGNSVATFMYPPEMNYQGGTAYLFNHDTGMGVFQLVNPDFSIGPMGLRAAAGNQIVFSIEGASETVSRCVVLREGTQDGTTYCSF